MTAKCGSLITSAAWKVRKPAASSHASSPTARLESQAIGKAYGATNTPQFFVLDKERKIRYTGAMDDNMKADKVTKHYLDDAVTSALKGEAPKVPETKPMGCGVQYDKATKASGN